METSKLHILARENFEYRDGKLFWRKATGRRVKIGDQAGCLRSDGYRTIMLNKKQYFEHRLIFLMFNPKWDIFDYSLQIDHINGKKNDNRIENLRLVTNQENHFNLTKAKGFYWQKQNQKFHAGIRINGKQKYLGCFDTEEMARSAYLIAKKKYHVISEK